jgi:glycosyltransferase involved in cell wall biosynthesis
MSCGIPAVVTDVGDAALLVGDTGKVVPPKNPGALGNAWGDLLALPAEKRQQMGQAARRRIQQHYSLETIAGKYRALWEEIRTSLK